MNQVLRGKSRDSAIIHSLEAWKVMDVRQIRLIHFNDIQHGLRKCQERMKKLHDKGRVNRWKGDEGYVYSLDEKPGRSEHLLQLNWVRAWFEVTAKTWEIIHCFRYEPDYSFIRPDSFVAVKNTVTGEFKFYFIELDRSSNKFNKVKLYNRLFKEQSKFSERWWVKLTKRFPSIIVVTHRKEKVLQHVQEDNELGLEFKVWSLDEIKDDIKNKGRDLHPA